MLHAWRHALTHAAPHLDLDEQTCTSPNGHRPTRSVRVVAKETNVASRMTAATTRHLLDVLAHAVHLPHPRDPAAYRTWRETTLVRAVRVRPRGDDPDRIVARTLPTALARLDRHPLIDAVHVTADEGTHTVWVTLLAHADWTRYGFREVTRLDSGVVRVVRGGRTWSMLATWRGGGWHVPNAPSLGVDVGQCFDARYWDEVW